MKLLGSVLAVAALLVVGLLLIVDGGDTRVVIGLWLWLYAAIWTLYGVFLVFRAVFRAAWRKWVRP